MPERQDAIDARRVLVVKALRAIHGYSLHEAVEDLNTRYLRLQELHAHNLDGHS